MSWLAGHLTLSMHIGKIELVVEAESTNIVFVEEGRFLSAIFVHVLIEKVRFALIARTQQLVEVFGSFIDHFEFERLHS